MTAPGNAATDLIAAERAHQLDRGFTPEYDNEHSAPFLLVAAAVHFAETTPHTLRQSPGRSSWSPTNRTHCKNGHPFDAANTYIHATKGTQECRRCRADRERSRHREKRA